MSEGRGWFKRGCCGCLVLSGLALLAVAVFVGLSLHAPRLAWRPEPVSGSHPGPPAGEGRAPASVPGGGATPPERVPDVREPGRIVLDVEQCDFAIRPGPPGSSIALESQFDAAHGAIEEGHESYGERGFIYRLRFEKRGARRFVPVFHEGNAPRLSLVVPREVPLVIEGRIGMGQSELELGGLWLVGLELGVGAGLHEIRFSEPLPFPLEALHLDTLLGELRIDRLGNASPRLASVAHSGGVMRVDLGGAWQRDGEVELSCGIGHCEVGVPDGVGLEVRKLHVSFGEANEIDDRPPAEPGGPTLHLSVTGRAGEVRIH